MPSSAATCWNPDQRTVSNFGNIIGELKERLHRWNTAAGNTGFLFDNARRHPLILALPDVHFAGWGDAPRMSWSHCVLCSPRASNEISDPQETRHL